MGVRPDSTSLQISWTAALTGVFRSDISLTDGTDVTVGTFGSYDYDDITADLHQVVTIERGRTSDGSAMTMGRAEFVLTDPTGKYNPENPSSALAGYLLPMRPIRYTETLSGTEYGQFWGFIEEITHDPAAKKSAIKAVDFFERLTTKPVIASTGPTTVGTAIGLVLDAREWTDATMRSLATGHNIADFSADGTKTGLQLISELLQIDLGAFFVPGSGVVTHQDLASRYKRQDPVATLTDALIGGGKPSTSFRGVMNKITVTAGAGTPQTASDADSIKAYDEREGSTIASDLLLDDAEAAALASWLVIAGKDPQPPVKEVTITSRDAANLALILSLEVGDFVEAVIDHAGNTVQGWIDHLRKSTSPGGAIYSATYTIRKKTLTAFTTDESLTDGTDVTIY
jgi:hypothetical protein